MYKERDALNAKGEVLLTNWEVLQQSGVGTWILYTLYTLYTLHTLHTL